MTDSTRARWRKSSHSSADGGQCVEVADLFPVVGVRDSKDPEGPRLSLGRAEFAALIHALRNDTV
ncbi:hypothetical protein BTM25_36290 [Actinomadura rubteroloni]|uniref:DUF397 domain-containing protein n=1 Tax=Actinomadura rubteroloni TaxID=1926885 RepID=A0A2P4UIZ9_9ACTN|nr:DUF397 domain-containing protein [Actinomadura rubteroloni]POM24988.1 hypothetical protein BTM25_36290 [Actinomadura rubteroloni]